MLREFFRNVDALDLDSADDALEGEQPTQPRHQPRHQPRPVPAGAAPPAPCSSDDDDDVPLDRRPTRVPSRTCSSSPAAAVPSEEVL